ncbi:MATE family efflux transporter, partial [Anaerotruncus sp. AF02-27]
MTQTPIPQLVCTLAVPTIISMLITSIYNMADTFFVGRISTTATGAVGVVFSLMAVIQALGFLFGQGSGNYISRKLGEQEFEEASRMAATGFFSALIAGGAMALLGEIFLDQLVTMLGATPTILPLARDYAKYILLGAPYMVASLVLNNQLRFQGSAMNAMVGITAGGVLNVALDPLFIFV